MQEQDIPAQHSLPVLQVGASVCTRGMPWRTWSGRGPGGCEWGLRAGDRPPRGWWGGRGAGGAEGGVAVGRRDRGDGGRGVRGGHQGGLRLLQALQVHVQNLQLLAVVAGNGVCRTPAHHATRLHDPFPVKP